MHWHNRGPVRRPPGFIEPCLPTNAQAVPAGPQWAYEIKHDGFRFLAVRQRKHVRIYSRGGHDWSKQVPALTDALQALPVRSAVLDGESVICGSDGKSDFDRMRPCFSRQGARARAVMVHVAPAPSSIGLLGKDRDVGSLGSKPIGSLGANSKMQHSVKLDGGPNLHVKVDAPRGTSVKAGTEGKMFSTVKVNRQASMPHVDEHGAEH